MKANIEKEEIMQTQIRYIIGNMPFDANGKHATGREVLVEFPDGIARWQDEYEGDETCDLPVTESDMDYEDRYWLDQLDWLKNRE